MPTRGAFCSIFSFTAIQHGSVKCSWFLHYTKRFLSDQGNKQWISYSTLEANSLLHRPQDFGIGR